MTTPTRPLDLVPRGEAIYDRMKAEVEVIHRGKFMAIDVDSGDYEIDAEDIDAISRLRERHPERMSYLVRIGFPAAYSMCGWREQRT